MIQFERWEIEVGKDTYEQETCRHVNKGSNHGQIYFQLSFSWTSNMKVKMINFPSLGWIIVHQVQQQ